MASISATLTATALRPTSRASPSRAGSARPSTSTSTEVKSVPVVAIAAASSPGPISTWSRRQPADQGLDERELTKLADRLGRRRRTYRHLTGSRGFLTEANDVA